MSYLSTCGGVRAVEYDADTEEWVELTSTFINQKTYLLLLNLLIELKKNK